jgi:hypothetical protein
VSPFSHIIPYDVFILIFCGGKTMAGKQLLGELLIEQNLVSRDVIDSALRVQVGGNRRLGHILVRMKAITADQLAETLAKQLGIPITDISQKFSREISRILPRYLCQQFGVIPLELKENNILDIAMANPSDEEAIIDLENYTGKVIKPCLARHSDIEREISRRIPLTIKDFFTPQTNTWATRAAVAVSLALVLGLSFFTYDYVQKSRYGTVTKTKTHILFNNHDLIVGVEKNGKVSLLGHGAFSRGYYSVSFDKSEFLAVFVHSREKDFSKKQREWLNWAIDQTESDGLTRSLALKN